MNRKDCSGVRRLEGEDLDYGDRLYKQRLQQKIWLEQQMQEKEAQKRLKDEEEKRWAEYTRQTNTLWKQNEDEFSERNRIMNDAVREANSQLTREKIAREALEKEEENRQAAHHIQNTIYSNFMTEDPATTQSMLAAHRVVPYHYKGMNEDQRRQILEEQKRQVEEKEQRKKEEKEKERREAKMSEAQRRALILYERDMKEKQERVNKETSDYLKTQMIEHKVKYDDPYNVKGDDYLIPL
mmetsp:Transcript_23694/g.23453  ORF Transcript_23694/g.23453 Transcript_23694/m.23453 type:complete len:240 (+) Transcript_23694:24-743(+)